MKRCSLQKDKVNLGQKSFMRLTPDFEKGESLISSLFRFNNYELNFLLSQYPIFSGRVVWNITEQHICILYKNYFVEGSSEIVKKH